MPMSVGELIIEFKARVETGRLDMIRAMWCRFCGDKVEFYSMRCRECRNLGWYLDDFPLLKQAMLG